MAYTHSKYEVTVAQDASVATAGDVGTYAPGYMPHIIRAIALVFTTVSQATGVMKVDKRIAAGSDTGRGDGDIAILNYTAAGTTAGQVIFIDGLDVELKPGEEAIFEITDETPTSGACHIIVYVEPRMDTPANESDMTETA